MLQCTIWVLPSLHQTIPPGWKFPSLLPCMAHISGHEAWSQKPGSCSPNNRLSHSSSMGQLIRQVRVKSREERFSECGHKAQALTIATLKTLWVGVLPIVYLNPREGKVGNCRTHFLLPSLQGLGLPGLNCCSPHSKGMRGHIHTGLPSLYCL